MLCRIRQAFRRAYLNSTLISKFHIWSIVWKGFIGNGRREHLHVGPPRGCLSPSRSRTWGRPRRMGHQVSNNLLRFFLRNPDSFIILLHSSNGPAFWYNNVGKIFFRSPTYVTNEESHTSRVTAIKPLPVSGKNSRLLLQYHLATNLIDNVIVPCYHNIIRQ